MKRIDEHTVHLTEAEAGVKEFFDSLLWQGHSIRDAAHLALTPALSFIGPSFVEWLSGGTLKVRQGLLVDALAPVPRFHWRWYHLIAVVLIGGMIGWWLSPGRAYAAEPTGLACATQYAHVNSANAETCRDRGWTIHHRVVLNPHRVVRYVDMPKCHEEDGSGGKRPCVWWGSSMGNDVGLTFYVTKDFRYHYFWSPSPATNGWRWLSEDRSDCVKKHHRVRCSDGRA